MRLVAGANDDEARKRGGERGANALCRYDRALRCVEAARAGATMTVTIAPQMPAPTPSSSWTPTSHQAWSEERGEHPADCTVP